MIFSGGGKNTPNNSTKAQRELVRNHCKCCSSSLPSAGTLLTFPLPLGFHEHSCAHLPFHREILGRGLQVGMWVFSVCDCILASPLQHFYQNYSQSSLIWILSFLGENSGTGKAVRGSGFPFYCLNFYTVQLGKI